MAKVIKEIKMMLTTCGLCQGDIAPPSRQFLPRFRPRKTPKTSETKLELLSIEAPSSTCLPGENGCDISTTTKTTTRTESTTMATTTTKTTPTLRNIVTHSKPRKIPKTSKTKLELLSIEAPSSTCLPGEKGCDISTTTKTSTRMEWMTMATTTTKTTPTLRDIVTHSKPTICLPGQPDCEQYKKCSVDKRSGRSHCKASGREEVDIALFVRRHHMNVSELL